MTAEFFQELLWEFQLCLLYLCIRNHSKNAKPAAFSDTKNGMLNFFIRQKQTTAELHISRILIGISKVKTSYITTEIM